MLTTAFKNRVDHITYDLIPLVLIIDRFNFVVYYSYIIYMYTNYTYKTLLVVAVRVTQDYLLLEVSGIIIMIC